MADETSSTETTTTDTAAADEGAPAEVTLESLQAQLADKEKIISGLRKENGKERINAKQQAAQEARTGVLDEIAKALGLKSDEKPTVEALQATVTEKDDALATVTAERDQAKLHLAVLRNAKTAGADPDLLLDSHSFTASLADVDLSNTPALIEQMKTWVQDNPKYAAAQVVGASTIEHTGGTGEKPIDVNTFKAMTLPEKATFARSNPAAFRAIADSL